MTASAANAVPDAVREADLQNPVQSAARDARRQSILAIAREVFLREGYAATSMSAIAAKVGGSKGTLYNYFPSKEALFAAVVQAQCVQDQAELWDMNLETDNVAETMTHLGRRVLKLMLSDEVLAIHRMVVAECTRFPEIGEALYDAGPRQGKRPLIRYMADCIDKGLLKGDDPERMAFQAGELVMAGLYRRRLWNVEPAPTEAEMEANVQAAVRVFMAAYGV
jgi:AcrR family transcriptional regulator